MDIPREGTAKRKNRQLTLILAPTVLALGGAAWGVARLQPALPSVDAAGVWSDVVARGPMVRQVHGVGTLVPQEVIWISAQTDGRIEKINIQPGTAVTEGTVIMELSNPAVVEAMTGAEFDVKQAEAAYSDLGVTARSNRLDRESSAAQVGADYQQAKIKAERDQKLADAGLIPKLDLSLSLAQAGDLEHRRAIEEKRLGIADESSITQLAQQRVKIDQLRALYELKKQQVEQLHIRAGVAGMLQQLGNTAAASAPPLEVGQNVAAGSILARVAQQDKLKAQVKVSETEARDVSIGQAAAVDTHNGVISGRISRIDPAAVNGTVLVDIALTGALPAGARPDLSVDGTIDIERLDDVLHVARPSAGQPNSTVTVFRLDPDGKSATHVRVRFGRASVNAIEVMEGLRPGDRIILSDMSAVDSHERIRLN